MADNAWSRSRRVSLMTQREMASKLGITASTVNKYENDPAKMTGTFMQRWYNEVSGEGKKILDKEMRHFFAQV